MLKEMKPENRYMIINIDESYAKEVYEILKAGQIEKGEWPEGNISFDEWVGKTWPLSYGEKLFRDSIKGR